MGFPDKQAPSLYIQSEGEDISTKVALGLTLAREKKVVRFTGGCGLMSKEDASGMYHLLTEPFRGFGGAVLFGGSRMKSRLDSSEIVDGITEIPPRIRTMCSDAKVLGVVARSGDLRLDGEFGLVVSDEPDSPYITVAHPDQDVCLVLQKSVDHGTVWDAEYLMCAQIVEHLISYAGWEPLLFCYNGGGVTEKEILLWARRNWPILLIKGSGRKSDEYANNKSFLKEHPRVLVAETSVGDIRNKLEQLSIVPVTSSREKLKLVGS